MRELEPGQIEFLLPGEQTTYANSRKMKFSPLTTHRSPVQFYQFPKTRFVSNTLWQQWWHLFSEVLELGWALLCRNWQHAMREAEDVSQSDETLKWILSGKGADIALAREQVISGCRERGYYQPPVGQSPKGDGI